MVNVIKFRTPFEGIKSNGLLPEITLWKAVIKQAMIDATNTSETKEAKKLGQEAKEWIFGEDENFKQMCFEVDIEPSWVIRSVQNLIKCHQNNPKATITIMPQKISISMGGKSKPSLRKRAA